MIEIGDIAPPLVFLGPDGEPRGPDRIAPGPLVLIFLRHLA